MKLPGWIKWGGLRERRLAGPVERVRFLTFANTAFMNTSRIVSEAKEFGAFDEIVALTEHDIPDYIEQHREFINENSKGYGLWIWKPKIIHDALAAMEEGEVLVYADAGAHINPKGKARYQDYLHQLERHDLVAFANNPLYRAQYYVKMDAVMSYHPRFHRRLSHYCYAGLMMVRNTSRSRALIADWLELCQQYRFLDQSPSLQHQEVRDYRGNDGDMGLFNLCLAKHRISHTYFPDEVNIYAEDGRQFIHTEAPYENCDWSPLDHVPFQCRRLAPDKVSRERVEGK